MIKKISFSLIFLLWLLPEFLVFAQESKSGKLEGLAKADFLYKKGVNGLKTNPEECIILFKEAQFIYKNQGKNTEVVNCVLSLAELHIRLSDYDIAYGLLTNALSLSEEFELTSQHLRALNYLSKVCSYLNETERALGFISEGIKLAESKKEENSIEFFKGLRAYLLMYYKKEYTESNFMEILRFYR
jgi:tetratricopeptide (TPR) repeat protein